MQKLFFFILVTALATQNPVHSDDSSAADGISVLIEVLGQNDDPGFQLDILKGINAAVEGKRHVVPPPGWAAVREKLLGGKDEAVRAQAQALSVVFGDDAAFESMRKTLADATAPAGDREKALASLRAAHDPTLGKLLQALLSDPVIRTPALSALADYDDPETAKHILDVYPNLDLPARTTALGTLAGRLEWARELIAAVQADKVPIKDLNALTGRQLRDLGDKVIDLFVDKTWGVARSTPKEKTDEIERFKKLLTDDLLKAADASRGRAVFARTCALCHTLYGEGGKVGPDLTGSNRANLDYFLLNVIDPSAIIAKDYQVTLLRKKDGQVLSGIATESDTAVKLVNETGITVVPRGEIQKMKQSDLSMMPEGLIRGFDEQELTDLVAYLRTTAPLK